MQKRMNRGEIIEIVVLIVGLFAFSAYISSKVEPGTVTDSSSKSSEESSGSAWSWINGGGASISNSGSSGGTSESHSTRIRLSKGNASYAFEPYEEYITIENRGDQAINISGWRLKNAKDGRGYDQGGKLKYFPADEAIIPQGALFIAPNGNNVFQNIILGEDEMAIITTGKMGSKHPYPIVSFKENMCSGYLAESTSYNFVPSLSRNCPDPAKELGVTTLDSECRDYIESMDSCHTPEFNTRDRNGDVCKNCVDGTPLSSSCVAFIKSKFNYPACIYIHSSDPDFSLNTWRIFLNHAWEMWADKYETISVFDQFNRLIDYTNY